MNNPIVKQLKEARAMYIHHLRVNHTQARGLCLAFWGRECVRLRVMLENVDNG